MRLPALLALTLLLTGCTVAPEGTTLSRMERSFYHPEYGTPRSEIGAAVFKRDAEECGKEADGAGRGRDVSLSETMAEWRQLYWGCWRAKGWRWE
jgi:hypothetical protein